MARVRPTAVAGQFYPWDAQQLKQAVTGYLEEARAKLAPSVEDFPPKAIIAPHAGYIYSGPIAGTAFAYLARVDEAVSRVILLGPAHWAHFRGLAASSAEAFATPLGAISLDKEAQAAVLELPQVRVHDDAHVREHCLEVQLPFLQMIFSDFTLMPLVVGEAEPSEVAEVLDLLWSGPDTVIVISSDLSHYLDYESARVMDKKSSKTIERLGYLTEGQACGRKAINGLIHLAIERGYRIKTVDLRNSGDTAGPRDKVVGYGAYVLAEQSLTQQTTE